MKAKGTQIYFVSQNAIRALGCPTAITGIDATVGSRDRTPLGSAYATSEPGNKTPSAVSISINYDTADQTHRFMRGFKEAGQIITLAVGLSDGTSAPTIEQNGNFLYPSDRSWAELVGYVTSFPLSAQSGAAMDVSFSFQQTRLPRIIEKADVGMQWDGQIDWDGGIRWAA